MKRYLKNLWGAICGSDPFRAELKDAKEKMKKSADNLSAMQNQLYSALEKWDQALWALEKAEAQVKSLQQLTENLRRRIAEKDSLIARMEKELK